MVMSEDLGGKKSKKENNIASIEGGADTDNVEAFVFEQDPVVETEKVLIKNGTETIINRVADLGADPLANDFIEKANVMKNEAVIAESTLDKNLSELDGTLDVNRSEHIEQLKERRIEVINSSNEIAMAGEHLIVAVANNSEFVVYPGAKLSIEAANKNTIRIKKDGHINIRRGNKNNIIDENTDKNEPEVMKTVTIDDLFHEMYPKGDTNMSTEQKTGEIVKSIVAQISQLPHFLEMEDIRYEAAEEHVNSFKRDVACAKASGINLDRFQDLDSIIANLDKKVLEIKDKKAEKQNLSPAAQPESIISETENVPKTEISDNMHNDDDASFESSTTTHNDNENASETSAEERISIGLIIEKFNSNIDLNKKEQDFLKNKAQPILNRFESSDDITGAESLLNEEEKQIMALFSIGLLRGYFNEGEEIKEVIKEAPKSKKYEEMNESEKKEAINKKNKEVGNELKTAGFEIKERIAEMKEQKEKLRKELDKKFETYVQMEKDVLALNSSESELSEETKNKCLETVRTFKELCKGNLNLERFSYLISSMEANSLDLNDPNALINKFSEHSYIMENWENTIGQIESEIEDMKKTEDKTMKEFLDWVSSHKKEIAIVGGSIIVGTLIVGAISSGTAASGALYAGAKLAPMLGPAKVAIASFMGIGLKAGLLGAFLLNEKKIDGWVESLTEKKIPSWATWGLKKKNEK